MGVVNLATCAYRDLTTYGIGMRISGMGVVYLATCAYRDLTTYGMGMRISGGSVPSYMCI